MLPRRINPLDVVRVRSSTVGRTCLFLTKRPDPTTRCV
jgi:hypothetical protein